MRIGVVTTSYPRWPGDSAGSFVDGHVRALCALGHDVEVVAASDGHARREIDARRDRDAPYRVDLRERERRAHERRGRDNALHEIDLRERERREQARREVDARRENDTRHDVDARREVDARRDVDARREVDARHDVGAPRGVDITRVAARGLFYDGGAPDAIERAPWRSMIAAAGFLPRFAATVAMRARRWDHIIAHWLVPSAIVAAATRKPLTAIAHGGDLHTLRRLHLLQPALRVMRDARLVFVSEQLRALAGVDGIVQPMGIDLAHFASLGRAPTTPPTILVAARLVPIKGVDIAIEAMAHVPNAQLVIAGDGPERRALQARARRSRVAFLGHVDTARRDQLLREASLVVVPSRVMPNGRTEGCPTIALEALAAGVPVVATIGRANELVAPDDPIALAGAIERVLSRPPRTDGLVADLDWIDVAKRLLRNE